MKVKRKRLRCSISVLTVISMLIYFIIPLSTYAIAPAPEITKITAYNTGNQIGFNAGDSIEIEFSTVIDAVYSAVYEIVYANSTFGENSSFEWINSNKTLKFTFGSDANLDLNTGIIIPQSSNIKAVGGFVAVNDTYSSRLSGSFGSGILPSAISAYAINSDGLSGASKDDKIAFVFDVPTYGDDIKDKFDVIFEDGSWDDSKTIYTVTIGNNTVTEGQKFSLSANSIAEESGEVYVANVLEATLHGSFNNVVKPSSFKAIAINANGTPSKTGDKVELIFDTKTNGHDIINSLGNVFGNGAKGTWINDNSIYAITLTTGATVEVGDVITLSPNSGLKDQNNILDVDSLSATLSGTFGTSVVPEAVRAYAIDIDGTAKKAGDKINIVFDIPVTQKEISSLLIKEVNGKFGNDSTATFIDSQTLEITLGQEAIISIGDILDVSKLNILDEFGITNVSTNNLVLSGSFGTAILPKLLSVTAVGKSGNGVATSGDEVRIVFNTKLNETALDLRDISFSVGSDFGGTGANIYWENKPENNEFSVLVIKLGVNPNIIPNKTKITINKDLYEVTGTKKCLIDNISNQLVKGTFGIAVTPELLSATIIKVSDKPLAQMGDKILFMYSAPTNGSGSTPNIISSLTLNNGNNVFGTGANGVWSNGGTIYEITLGTGLGLPIDSSQIVFANNNLMDVNELSYVPNASITLKGSFGMEPTQTVLVPTKIYASIVKMTSKPYSQAGDQIVLTFDKTTNGKKDNINLVSKLGNKFNTSTGAWDNDNRYTITLGTGANITDNETITLQAGSGIKDVDSIQEAFVSDYNFVLNGSFGTPIAPKLVSAVIVKKTVQPLAQVGDQIVLTFSNPTNGEDISGILGLNFGTGATTDWSNEYTVGTIELKSGNNLVDGAIISILSNSILKDKNGLTSAIQSNKTIEGSFGMIPSSVALVPTSATAIIVKTTQNTIQKAQQGDRIIIAFNVLTNGKDGQNVPNLISHLSTSTGQKFGTNATGIWSNNGSVYTITLGNNPNILTDDQITIGSDAGLKDKEGMANSGSSITISKMIGSFGNAVAPELISATAYSKNGIDYIGFEFNTVTNKTQNIPVNTSITVDGKTDAFGLGAKGTWNSVGNIYTIALGNNYIVKKGDMIKLADGLIKDKDNIINMTSLEIVLIGELRKPTVTKVEAKDTVIASPGVNKGDKVIIAFSSKVDIKDINLNSISGLIGLNATSELDESKTILTLTLGDGVLGIYDGTHLAINGLQIKDPFTGEVVLGQYQIEGTFGTLTGDVKAVSAIASSNDKLVITAQKGDLITIKFNAFVDKVGTADLSDLLEDISKIGSGATGLWKDSNKLIITLGDAPTIANGDEITIKQGKIGYAANGKNTKNVETINVLLTGSFDGREYVIRNSSYVVSVAGKYIEVKAQVEKSSNGNNSNACYTFALYDNDTLVGLHAVKVDIATSAEIMGRFYNMQGNIIKIYATDSNIDDVTNSNVSFIANTIELSMTNGVENN